MNLTAQTSPEFTLRLLNGMLSGVEFSLPARRTLFCVGEAAAFDAAPASADALTQAEDTLFIPAHQHGPNFAVDASPNFLGADFSFEIFENMPRVERGQYQVPCRAGALVFALKPAADPWDAAVLNFSDGAPVVAEPVQPAGKPKPEYKGLVLNVLLSLSLVTVVAVAATAGWRYLDIAQSAQVETSLTTLLQDGNHRFAIRKGSDQVFYVLARTTPDAAWARQALARSGLTVPVRVLTLPEERARIARWLDERQVAYFTVRLDEAGQAELLLSRERSDESAIKALLPALQSTMPYAADLALNWQSDAAVATEAATRLEKLGLTFQRQGDPKTTLVYMMRADIDDGALSQLRTQLDEFERAYGERYVRFVLVMSEDWLKGQSFKYGANGYVQVSPTFWYFPKPL